MGLQRIGISKLFLLGAAFLIIAGVISSNLFPDSSLDIHLTDTYFVIAHFHVFLLAGTVLVLFAGVYAVSRFLFRRRLSHSAGLIHFWTTFPCLLLILWPTHFSGISGKPRRYYDYSGWNSFSDFTNQNQYIALLTVILILSQLVFALNFLLSIFWGKKAA